MLSYLILINMLSYLTLCYLLTILDVCNIPLEVVQIFCKHCIKCVSTS